MASTFTAAVRLALQVVETLDDGDLQSGSTLLHTGYDVTANLSASSTPDLTEAAFDEVTLSTGATVDMTSLNRNGESISLSGLKPRAVELVADADNSGNITIVKGASNGYDGIGASFSITLEPGMSVLVYFSTQGNAVSGTNKTLDASGTDDDTFTYSFIAGT